MDSLTWYQFLQGFFSCLVLKVSIVNIIGGYLYGASIGFVSVYVTYYEIARNCTMFTSEAACVNSHLAGCQWNYTEPNSTTAPASLFQVARGGVRDKPVPDVLQSNFAGDYASAAMPSSYSAGVPSRCYRAVFQCTGLDHADCAVDDYNGGLCFLDYRDGQRCKDRIGFTPLQTGIFAGAFLVGGMMGTWFASRGVDRFGRRGSMRILSIVALLSCLTVHLASEYDLYPLLLVGRWMLGVALGVACVACPMYTQEMQISAFRKPSGMLYQVFTSFGVFMTAVLGWGFSPEGYSSPVHMQLRTQGFIAALSAAALATALMSFLIPESSVWLNRKGDSNSSPPLVLPPTNSPSTTTSPLLETSTASSPAQRYGIQADAAARTELSSFNEAEPPQLPRSWCSLKLPLLTVVIMACGRQWTGINAFMNYSPMIMESVGLSPLQGNFAVLAWYFVSALVSIALSNRWSLRRMFLVALGIAAVSCLLTGVALLPHVMTSLPLKAALSCIGAAGFILSFSAGLGPAFFVLVQEVFPTEFRSRGTSFANMMQFVLNLFVNVGFPIAASSISGGPSGNQDLGLGVLFVVFGVIGGCSLTFLMPFLHPWERQ